MDIRRASVHDADRINDLLRQVAAVHNRIRPDLFKAGQKKYTDAELLDIIRDDQKPIFVGEENGQVLGYAFCVFQQHVNDNVLTDVKTLYIDDLCVDQSARGKGVGRALYDYAVRFARESGCYNLTLNVWAGNDSAQRFYEAMGMKPQKTGMECIL